MWGRAGSAIALVPSDATASLAAVASDHASGAIHRLALDVELRTHRIWIDMVDLTGIETARQVDDVYRRTGTAGSRPETFDRSVCFRLLGDLLKERGLDRERIGVDLEFMPAADFHALTQALPQVAWRDGSLALRRLRMVTPSSEIGRLRHAASAAAAGLIEIAAHRTEDRQVGDRVGGTLRTQVAKFRSPKKANGSKD